MTKTKSATKAVAKSTKRKSTKAPKPSTRAKSSDPLAICPANGAGWCPYPFSVAQLKKRLKEKARLKQLAEQASS